VIKAKDKDNQWDASGLASCSGKMLVSSQLDAYGPPTSSEHTPFLVAPCDDEPIRYAHVMTN
jgi:hypothetical protein